MTIILWLLLGAAVIVCAGALFIAALSRHKKSATGPLALDGVARVYETLSPEGAIILNGELWRACSYDGSTILAGATVRVVGASGHLLQVAPLTHNE